MATSPHEYFLKRQMQVALYSLKRQYGGPIVIYRLLNSAVDDETGEVTTNTLSYRVYRAIILPATMTRELLKDLASTPAIKQLMAGGGYDRSRRVFIVDRRDVRDLTISLEDWLVWNGGKFQFEKIEELEFDTGWVITGHVLLGETELETGLQQSVDAADAIMVTSDVDSEVA
jgi:hypothetical protein